jgi:hypothetical protein
MTFDLISSDIRKPFKVLTLSLSRDFKIICRDGAEVFASRIVLYLSTDYFRNFFNEVGGLQQTEHSLSDFSATSMEILVQFIHSTTIRQQENWTFSEANEIMQLVELLKPSRKDDLRVFVHRTLITTLKQVRFVGFNFCYRFLGGEQLDRSREDTVDCKQEQF